ncbi:MAG: hypothetical protein H7Y39_08305 [Nitrospiraceae bacterium]|nr:hypothetical protein [Nitrospiraceae bacterium]
MASSSDMYTPDEVTIRFGRVRLDGYLGIPLSPLGGVVFAHGSGRPDLAEAYLQSMTAPTMLIVGGDDEPVIEMNRAAYRLLSYPKRLVIVPGATHLFEEPGTLEEVEEHALAWFQQHVHPTPHEGADPRTKERLR